MIRWLSGLLMLAGVSSLCLLVRLIVERWFW